MAPSARFYGTLLGLLIGVGVMATGTGVVAQPDGASSGATEGTVADSTDHPNQQPYVTDRSVAYHVLASPAYVLHGLTRPLGWGVRYVEQEFPTLFEARRPTRGILPLIDLGGPTGFLGGLVLYDDRLFGRAQSARIEGLYGGPNTFDARASYERAAAFGPGTRAQFVVNFFSDPESEFFLQGNASARNADEAVFGRDQVDVTASLEMAPSDGPIGGHFDLLYEHAVTDVGGGVRGARLADVDPAGLGRVDLLTSRLSVGLDRARGRPRTFFGTDVVLSLDYTHDLTSKRFRYGRYVAEVRQYLPVGLFPNSRRLAVRGRLEQVEPVLGGEAVPFYQLPGLGGQSLVRGFGSNRFQGKGSLVVNVEYRYPIWTNWDALVFVDSGQVFSELSAVAVDRFHWSYGGGLHALNAGGLRFRFEVAASSEGVRTILTVAPTFRRIAR